jgi:hypothetical protein
VTAAAAGGAVSLEMDEGVSIWAGESELAATPVE